MSDNQIASNSTILISDNNNTSSLAAVGGNNASSSCIGSHLRKIFVESRYLRSTFSSSQRNVDRKDLGNSNTVTKFSNRKKLSKRISISSSALLEQSGTSNHNNTTFFSRSNHNRSSCGGGRRRITSDTTFEGSGDKYIEKKEVSFLPFQCGGSFRTSLSINQTNNQQKQKRRRSRSVTFASDVDQFRSSQESIVSASSSSSSCSFQNQDSNLETTTSFNRQLNLKNDALENWKNIKIPLAEIGNYHQMKPPLAPPPSKKKLERKTSKSKVKTKREIEIEEEIEREIAFADYLNQLYLFEELKFRKTKELQVKSEELVELSAELKKTKVELAEKKVEFFKKTTTAEQCDPSVFDRLLEIEKKLIEIDDDNHSSTAPITTAVGDDLVDIDSQLRRRQSMKLLDELNRQFERAVAPVDNARVDSLRQRCRQLYSVVDECEEDARVCGKLEMELELVELEQKSLEIYASDLAELRSKGWISGGDDNFNFDLIPIKYDQL